MIYPTLRATVRKGKIQLLDDAKLPENALVLVTVMDEAAVESLTLGERIAAGLQDILFGRTVEVKSAREMDAHLDHVLG